MADATANARDLPCSHPAGLCDVALPLVGWQHVPGTAENHYLCTDVAAQKVLSALNNFDNSDLSNAVYGGVMDMLSGARACAGNLQECAQGTLLLTA